MPTRQVRSYFLVFVPTIREIRDFYREMQRTNRESINLYAGLLFKAGIPAAAVSALQAFEAHLHLPKLRDHLHESSLDAFQRAVLQGDALDSHPSATLVSVAGQAKAHRDKLAKSAERRRDAGSPRVLPVERKLQAVIDRGTGEAKMMRNKQTQQDCKE
eukprot:SAG31_NODE_905_length_11119_cov_2.887931_12_plen_159_part_00